MLQLRPRLRAKQSCGCAFRIIEKCLASDQFVLDAVISKSGTDSGSPRNNILRKLGFHTVAELVLYAVRNEIVHLARPVSLRQNRIFPPMRATQSQSAAND